VLKSAAAGLVDDVLVGEGVEFGNDVVSCFAADQETA